MPCEYWYDEEPSQELMRQVGRLRVEALDDNADISGLESSSSLSFSSGSSSSSDSE